MDKGQAITILSEYISKKPFSLETIYHVDMEPNEYPEFWLFKNLQESRDAIRDNNILADTLLPFILLHKETLEIREISISEFNTILNSL